MKNEKLKSQIIQLLNEQKLYKSGFTSSEYARPRNSHLYKTAIVVLFPYFVENEVGRISVYARGRDYHGVIREKLTPITNYLKENGAEYADIFGDTGGLDDRNAAVKAGLGFIGRNGMVISDEYGSYTFIGIILTDVEFEFDNPDLRECLNCGKCEEYCTGGALCDGGFIIEKCVSHISQKKDELTECEKNLILKSGMCWGCDVCQSVCPHNDGICENALEEFKENRICDFDLSEFENMSNREFMRRYKNYAFSWRGIKPILRNLKILRDKDSEI